MGGTSRTHEYVIAIHAHFFITALLPPIPLLLKRENGSGAFFGRHFSLSLFLPLD
jgi:hypothetical protein